MLIFIYNDFGGTHSTSLAAAYHLKKLSSNQKLSAKDILDVPYFNKLSTSDKGRFIFHGKDENGNRVFTIGRHSSDIAVTSMVNLSRLFNEEFNLNEKIIFSDTSPTVPFPMTIGGFLSRVLKVDFLGVPLLIWGAKIAYKDIVELVNNTILISGTSSETVVQLDNKQFK